jgi:hypothetical protein
MSCSRGTHDLPCSRVHHVCMRPVIVCARCHANSCIQQGFKGIWLLLEPALICMTGPCTVYLQQGDHHKPKTRGGGTPALNRTGGRVRSPKQPKAEGGGGVQRLVRKRNSSTYTTGQKFESSATDTLALTSLHTCWACKTHHHTACEVHYQGRCMAGSANHSNHRSLQVQPKKSPPQKTA